MENLTDVVDRSLHGLDPLRGGGGGRGLVNQSPLAQEPRALGPQDQKAPSGAGTHWRASCRDPKWPSGARTWKLLGPRDPKWSSGAGT
jgi:hypothetical protein